MRSWILLSSTFLLSTSRAFRSLSRNSQRFTATTTGNTYSIHKRHMAPLPAVPARQNPSDARFWKFVISEDCIFFRSASSVAFVNLRPIVPGHVLVMPDRMVPYLTDLTDAEYLDLWSTVRIVQKGLLAQQLHNEGSGLTERLDFNVAVQDGRAAGQSVPHVHVHILPRTANDLENSDDVYQDLEQWAPRNDPTQSSTASSTTLVVPEQRTDRTREEMAAEASQYRDVLAAIQSSL